MSTRPRRPTLAGGALLPAILTMGLWSCGSKPSFGPVNATATMNHVRAMVGHGKRHVLSGKRIDATRRYLQKQIKALGLKPRIHRYRDPDTKIVFQNVWTEIPGADPENGPVLILCAHYDTKLCERIEGYKFDIPEELEFVGAIDGGGASAVILELARHLTKRKNKPNIWVVWFDGEESLDWTWNDDVALNGSRAFARDLGEGNEPFTKRDLGRVKSLVLLDLIGSKNYKIDQDNWSSPDLLKIFKAAATKMGEQDRMFANKSEIKDDHYPFKRYGVPVIDLIDFHYRQPGGAKKEGYEQWWHTEQDNLQAMDPAALEFAGNLVWVALPLLEEKYYGGPVQAEKTDGK